MHQAIPEIPDLHQAIEFLGREKNHRGYVRYMIGVKGIDSCFRSRLRHVQPVPGRISPLDCERIVPACLMHYRMRETWSLAHVERIHGDPHSFGGWPPGGYEGVWAAGR